MFGRILVPLDSSKLAEVAVPIAARIARASEGTIVFVGVVLPPIEFGTYTVEHTVELKPSAFERREEAMIEYLSSLTDTYADELAGIPTEIDLSTGAAAPEIEAVARAEEADLIVLCRHGETDLTRWFFGEVAQQLVRHSPVPVLILEKTRLSAATERPLHPLRALVPLDGSKRAESAILPAAQLLYALGASLPGELHLLRVVDVPSAYGRMKEHAHIEDTIQEEARLDAEQYMQTITHQSQAVLAQMGLHVQITSSVIVESTDVAETIVQQAQQIGDEKPSAGSYDVIAIATHGRGGLRRLVMGSVAERLLSITSLPLLVVRLSHTHVSSRAGSGKTPSMEAAVEL